MKEHGLICKSDMVKAFLEGRKTQTRRIIKPQPVILEPPVDAYYHIKWKNQKFAFEGDLAPYAPYQVGDRIYVREGILLRREEGTPYFDALYCADNSHLDNLHELDDWFKHYRLWYDLGKSKQIVPTIHMPKRAARIWREIAGIRAGRVQDISIEDIIAEGVVKEGKYYGYGGQIGWEDPFWVFKTFIWDSCYGKGAWDKNDWGWVLELKEI